MKRIQTRSILPGFRLSLGITVLYLSLIVLIPLSSLFLKTAQLSWHGFIETVTSARVIASYKLTFGASFVAASINAVLGLLVAWVLVRYPFPGKRIFDALVDLPFALPTAVAGIALTNLYSSNGWIGHILESLSIKFAYKLHSAQTWVVEILHKLHIYLNIIPLETLVDKLTIKIAYTPLGIMIALTFIGLPFVVRTLQPVLQDLDPEMEEAASSLGASRIKTFTAVIFPHLFPALLTGFALAFARALGEYGSVVFISGNMPLKTEITPLLIMTKLEQFDYAGATAIALVMLIASFALLLCINLLQSWQSRRSS